LSDWGSLRGSATGRLRAFARIAEPLGERRAAAVAIALVPDAEGRPSFVLTRRAAKLRNHAGQWALPGGRLDEGECAEQAALRELSEEVGLSPGPGSVLGLLDDYPTRSGYVITPVVVWGGDRPELVGNPREVASVHRVPLAELEQPGVPRLTRIPESDRPVISIPMVGTFVHAPTAAILFQLREVVLRGQSTRVAHFEQPVFAWR
jgi:8-oxo-dGTP pyrophosphatase MutT (NUDIX family)